MRQRPRRRRLGIVLMMVAAAVLAGVPAHAAVDGDTSGQPGVGTLARYGDRVIDLAHSWEGAGACLVWPEVLDQSECFDTEAEMDRRIAALEAATAVTAVAGNSSGAAAASGSWCSSSLRLYDGIYYTGAVLYLRGRWQWFNLADYGFDQRTSSFKVGACSAWFADWRNGGGEWYPTSATEADDQASVMISGWDNDVSSVYIT